MRAIKTTVAVASLVFLILIFANQASAAPPAYSCQITAASLPSPSECNEIGNTLPHGAFHNPLGVAVDGHGNVWVADSEVGNDQPPTYIDTFDYLGNFLTEATGEGHWTGEYTHSIAYSDAANKLYVADRPKNLWVLNSDGSFSSGISGLNEPWGAGCCDLNVAVDNSSAATRGDVYVTSEGAVYRIDAEGNPAPFSGTDAYINANALTGTPSRGFGDLTGVATDGNGNLYVIDRGSTFRSNQEVDEFSSEGIFIRSITGPPGEPFGPSGGVHANQVAAVAADPVSGDVFIAAVGRHVIYEFDSSGEYVGKLDGSETPAGSLLMGESLEPQLIAVDPFGRLFVADSGHRVVDVFGGPPPIKPKITYRSPTGITTTAATANAELDPNGAGEITACHLEYGPTGSYGETALCTPDPAVAGFEEPEHVSATLSGLEAGRTYHYRFVISSGAITAEGSDKTVSTQGPPIVESSSARVNIATSAVLEATIDPNGASTAYQFEYGTDATYGSSVPVPASGIGAGHGGIEVSQQLGGLAPETTYHFRVVATNAVATTESPDIAFTTPPSCSNEALRNVQGSTFLPNCRAYELVSPPDKNGGSVLPRSDRSRAAADGGAFQFASMTGFGDTQGSGNAFEYTAVRTAAPGTNGWTTHGITPPNLESNDGAHRATLEQHYVGRFSTDLEDGVFISVTPLTSESPAVSRVPNLYLGTHLRAGGSGQFRLLSACPACVEPLVHAGQPGFAAASADYSHVLFEDNVNLTSEAAGLSEKDVKLYEWINGNLYLAGILPDDECGSATPPCSAPRSEAGRGAFDSEEVQTEAQPVQYTENTISENGSRIYFTVQGLSQEGAGTSGQLYLRTDNGTPNASTVRINASERSVADSCQAEPPTCPNATFWTATPDGRYAFFSTKEKLLDEVESTGAIELYRYDAAAPQGENLTLVSPDETGGGGALVSGAIGASSDGGYVYFISNAQIVKGAPSGGYRIFVWHEGTVHEVSPLPSGNEGVEGVLGGRWSFTPKLARVSPNGDLAFVSRGIGEMLHPGQDDSCAGGVGDGCTEVYFYDPRGDGGNGRLTCASCTPGDAEAPAHTDATFFQRIETAGTAATSYLNHPLSDDGRYLFFSTGEALVPGDIDGVYDAYEYDAATGRVHLLSTGEGNDPSYFMDASADGSSAFVATSDRLNGWDFDESRDIYDARVDGGLPEPPPPPPACVGDACQPPPQTLTDPTPASATFVGAGNVRNPHRKHRHHRSKKHRHRRGRPASRRHG